jgi:hypothetical protein
MSDSPSKLNVKLSSKKELKNLYEKYGFEQRIKRCTPMGGPPLIHPFCCTTMAVRYIDEAINEEIASISETVYAHPDGAEKAKKRTEITRLVIYGVIYQLKHP